MYDDSGAIQLLVYDAAGHTEFYSTHQPFITQQVRENSCAVLSVARCSTTTLTFTLLTPPLPCLFLPLPPPLHCPPPRQRRQSVYIVVFNTTWDVSRLYTYVRAWCESICARTCGRAVVAIVGTHCDIASATSNRRATMQGIAVDAFDDAVKHCGVTLPLLGCFLVSSLTGQGLSSLTSALVHCVNTDPAFEYTRATPTAWVLLADEIRRCQQVRLGRTRVFIPTFPARWCRFGLVCVIVVCD